MDKILKVWRFVFTNRRLIGLIVGSGLTLAGFPEYGIFVSEVSESHD